MGNVVNQIAINDTVYKLKTENASLALQVSLLQADLIRIEAALNAINVSVPVDRNLSSISLNPISNKSVSDTFDKVDARLKILEDKWDWLNLSDMATKDYVMSNLNLQQLTVKTSLDINSSNPISSSAVANEIIALRNELINYLNTIQLTYVSKDLLLKSKVQVDSSISPNSSNPVSNKAIAKEINKLQAKIDDQESTIHNALSLFTFSNNTIYVNNTPLISFSESDNNLKITVLGSKASYNIPLGTIVNTASTQVYYNNNTNDVEVVTGNHTTGQYNSSSKTLTLA